MRNVWRASFPGPFSLHYAMFKIYCDLYGFRDTCPPKYTVRNVWRASLLGSLGALGPPRGRPCRQERPRDSKRHRWAPIRRRQHHPEEPFGTVGHPFGVASIIRRSLSDLTSECWRLHPSFRWRTSSVGGSAMHMKRPDDVGREAGSGPTPNWKELTMFRACP